MTISMSEMWNSNFGLIGEVKARAFSAMSQLESQALSSATTLYHQATTAFDALEVAPVDVSALPTAAEIDAAVPDVELSIPDIPSIDVSALPTVAEIMASVQDITPDPFPAPPEAGEIEKYKRHVWEDTHLDQLQTVLMAMVEAEGMPTQAHQDAIFDQDKERKQRALADSIDIIKAQTSGRGFRYANGQTNAAILDLMQKHQYDLENQTREITKLCEEWARQNFQFSIQQGLSVEQMHMDFAYKYSTIFRELYTTLLTAVLEKYRTQIQVELEKMEANIKAVMARTEAYKANADIAATTGRLRLDLYQTQIQAGISELDARVRVGLARVDASKADTDIRATAGKLQLDKYHLDIQQALGVFNGSITSLHNSITRSLNAATAYANTTSGLIQATTNNVLGVYNEKSQ